MPEKPKKSDEFNELSLDELLERKKQMLELLAHLEDEYRSAAVSEASYKQAKGSNLKKLELIKKKLEEFGILGDDAPPAPSQPKPADAPKAPAASAPAAPQTPAVPASGSAPASPPAAPSPASVQAPTPSANPAPSAVSILRQIISPSQPSSAGPSFEMEVHKLDEKLAVELERIRATIDALKESKTAADERMQRMTESVAELRSMIFQRETTLKNYDIKIEKISETMADIEPQRIAKDFGKRDKAAAESDARIEKLERKTEDMMKTISDTNALLKSIGGLENIAEVDHAIVKKVEKMAEMLKAVERFSEKTERMFIEVNKRLEEFTAYKARQESMDEIVRDLVKSVDRMGIRFESYLEKKELVAFREKADGLEKQFDAMKKALKRAVPFIDSEIPKELLELQKERDNIAELIASVKSGFEQKRISEAEYKKIMEKNEAKLADTDRRLADAADKFRNSESEKDASGKRKEQSGVKEQKPPAEPTKSISSEQGAEKPADAPAAAAPKLPEKKRSDKGISFGGFGKKASSGAAGNAAQKPAGSPDTSGAGPEPDGPPTENGGLNAGEDKVSKKPAEEQKLPAPPAEPENSPAAAVSSDKNPLMSELESSFKEGLITKEAYELAKKMLLNQKTENESVK